MDNKNKKGILERFDSLIESAPLDFLGTGSNCKAADKEEKEWREEAASIRAKLKQLIDTFDW